MKGHMYIFFLTEKKSDESEKEFDLPQAYSSAFVTNNFERDEEWDVYKWTRLFLGVLQ